MVVDKTEESITIRSLNPKRSTKYMTKKYAGATHNRDSQITLEPVLRSPAQESNDMTPDTFVLLLFRKVTHAGPCQPTTWKESAKGSRTRTETYSRQNPGNNIRKLWKSRFSHVTFMDPLQHYTASITVHNLLDVHCRTTTILSIEYNMASVMCNY